MRWFDWNDEKFVLLFIGLCVIALAVLFTIVLILYLTISNYFFEETVKDESKAPREFIVELNKGRVSYFNKNKIKRKTTVGMEDFYNKFCEPDRNKLREWLLNIAFDHKKENNVLPIDVFLWGKRETRLSLLKLISYNEEKHIIHLESHILKYARPNNVVINKTVGVSFDEYKKSLNFLNRKLGYTFCFQIFDDPDTPFINDDQERIAVYSLKDILYGICDKRWYRIAIEKDFRTLLVVDRSINNVKKAKMFTEHICELIKKQIAILNMDEVIKFSIGVCKNSYFENDYDEVYEASRECALFAKENNHNHYIYEQYGSIELKDDVYKKEINLILTIPHKLSYLYTPILDVQNGTTYGFITKIRFHSSCITSYEQMMKYGYRFEKGEYLYSLVTDGFLNQYIEKISNKNIPIFLSTTVYDLIYAEKVLNRIRDIDKISVVLALDGNDVKISDAAMIASSIRELKQKGFKFALLLDHKFSTLDTNLYPLFDYFLIAPDSSMEYEKDKIISFSLRILIESLLKYKKPIIATSIPSWKKVELMVISGLQYVASDSIARYSEYLLPISRKKIEKIVEINDSSY